MGQVTKMAELNVPDYMQNKPVNVVDLYDFQDRTRANQQELKMNEMKMAEAQKDNELQNKTNQLQYQSTAHALGSKIATDIVGKVQAMGIDPSAPDFQQKLDQVASPYRPLMASAMGQPDNGQPIHWESLMALKGLTAQEQGKADIQQKLAEKQALFQYEHDFTPQTSPSGDVVFYDKKHPNAAPIFPQQAGGTQQPIGNVQQPQRPTNGLINIFEQPQQNLSPKSAQLQQEEDVKLSAEAQKLRQQQELERNKQDVALIQSEPEKLAGISKAAMNLQGLGENLNKYGEQVKSDWLPTDNSIAYNARQVLGSNTVLNDITQANGQIMVDTMRSMKQDSGVSPSQLMNTEKEWERQLAAATGQGTVESRKNAWEKLTRELHQTYNSYEKTRAGAYKRQNKEYKPLINADILPGAKVMEMDTNNMPIGQTGVLNGKKIRVIGQNQIEVID